MQGKASDLDPEGLLFTRSGARHAGITRVGRWVLGGPLTRVTAQDADRTLVSAHIT